MPTHGHLQAANNNYYLGLKISNSFGSVLNGGREWQAAPVVKHTHMRRTAPLPPPPVTALAMGARPSEIIMVPLVAPHACRDSRMGWRYPRNNAKRARGPQACLRPGPQAPS